MSRAGREAKLDGKDGLLVVLANFDRQGGLQVLYRSLVEEIAARRPVVVLTWRGGGPRSSAPAGCSLIRAPALLGWHREHPSPLAELNTAFSVLGGLAVALARRRRWGAVLAAGLNPEGLVAALACRPTRRRFLLDTWLPGPLGNAARLSRSRWSGLHRRLLSQAVGLMAGTAEIASELEAAGFDPRQVVAVNKGIDLERWTAATPGQRSEACAGLNLDPARRYLAYWGRLDLRQKRIDLLLDGWERAKPEGWELIIAGDGPDRDELEARVEGIEGVVMLGWMADPRPVARYASAFVLPTNFEETGLAMLEGLAAGLPGLVSRTPAFAEQAPAGVELVDNTPEAWAAAIAWIAAMPDEQLGALGYAGRRWVEEHGSIKSFAARVEALLFEG